MLVISRTGTFLARQWSLLAAVVGVDQRRAKKKEEEAVLSSHSLFSDRAERDLPWLVRPTDVCKRLTLEGTRGQRERRGGDAVAAFLPSPSPSSFSLFHPPSPQTSHRVP